MATKWRTPAAVRRSQRRSAAATGGTSTPVSTAWLEDRMRSYPRRSKRLTAAGKSGRYRRYARVAWGSRWMNEVITRRRSMTGATEPGTWSRVKRSASGNSSQNTSRQRSPPRIPVSQSCTKATFMARRLGGGLRPPSDASPQESGVRRQSRRSNLLEAAPAPPSGGRAANALPPVVEELGERAFQGNLDPPPG